AFFPSGKEYLVLTYVHLKDAYCKESLQYFESEEWWFDEAEFPIWGMTEGFAKFIHENCRCIYCKKPVPESLEPCACGKQKKLINVEFPSAIWRTIFEAAFRNYIWTDRGERTLYRRKKRIAAAGAYKQSDIDRLLVIQHNCCYYCGTEFKVVKGKVGYHIDHYHSVADGGRNEMANLVLACPPCNNLKGKEYGASFSLKVNKTLTESNRNKVKNIKRRVSRFKAKLITLSS
ncbi:MAG: HNH endonuclease, partial [Phycisphaerae bacterium]|nr:HNH endonuclease [Phycisphaerae bacterium]